MGPWANGPMRPMGPVGPHGAHGPVGPWARGAVGPWARGSVGVGPWAHERGGKQRAQLGLVLAQAQLGLGLVQGPGFHQGTGPGPKFLGPNVVPKSEFGSNFVSNQTKIWQNNKCREGATPGQQATGEAVCWNPKPQVGFTFGPQTKKYHQNPWGGSPSPTGPPIGPWCVPIVLRGSILAPWVPIGAYSDSHGSPMFPGPLGI